MTKVTRLVACVLFILAPAPLLRGATTGTEALYLQLGSVGLDASRVYEVRETQLNRPGFQISLEEGTIAFTQDVTGRVTGAFFQGDGEVLLLPPDQVERASMALFTGAAILEEHFVSAYFRFNDDTFHELQPTLRPADNAQDFVSLWNETAKNLAGVDSLRLLLSFSRFLPTVPPSPPAEPDPDDHLLHARLQGRKLGTFDLYYDSEAHEQVSAGQLKTTEEGTFYDVWTSFSLKRPGEHRIVNGITAEEGKSDTLAVSQYKIRAEIAPPTTLNADTTLQVDVRQGGQRAALFELSRFLQIKTLEADGHAVEYVHNPAVEGTQLARRGNDLVAVVFPEPLRTGQKILLHFVYAGDVLSLAANGLLYVGARGTWYPNRGLAMANFDLEFHYPAGWTLLATGKRVEMGTVPETLAREPAQVSRWVSERPIPIAGFNLGKYTRATAQAGDVTVEAYAASTVERDFPKAQGEVVIPAFPDPRHRQPAVVVTIPPPPSPAQNVRSLADRAAEAVEFYAKHFGPYPYGSLALTQLPGNLSQGWPGLIFLSSLSFLTPEQQAQLHMPEADAIENQMVVSHETAHQWWGDLLVWSSYRDQWIVEALANYSALMLLEAQDPAKFRLLMDKYRDELIEKDKDGVASLDAGPVTLGSRLSNSHFPGGYEAISYGRGTWLVHMLRCMLRDSQGSSTGEEPIFRVLRNVRERYQGRSISTRELLGVFAEELPPNLRYEGHKSLDWFYDGWVNGTAVPRYELQSVKYVDKNAGTIISGTILQKAAPKDLVTPVPIYASLAGHNVFLGRVFAEGPDTAFRLTAPAGARRAVLDPGQTLLARVK